MAEIPLELEGPKKERRGVYVPLGVAIGYYVNVGTLQYAYKLFSEAQAPPPDIYLVAYAAGKSLILTPMGTQLLAQPIGLDEKISYVGDAAEYSVYVRQLCICCKL